MSELLKVLEDSRPQIETALADAARELAELQHRELELRALIARANAALGHDPVPIGTSSAERLTLHEAIRQVLLDHGNQWLTVRELADEINARGLYEKRDGSPVEPNQIHARTKNYTAIFEKDGPRIRLRDSAGDALLARRASAYLATDHVRPAQAATYRELLTSGPTGDPMRDYAPGLDRADVIAYAGGDLRSDHLPDDVRERLRRLEEQMPSQSHRWPKGLLATALAMTE